MLKRLLLSALLFCSTAHAQSASVMGYLPGGDGSSAFISTVTFDSTIKRYGYGFTIPYDKTLSKVSTYILTKTGTVGTSDLVMDLWGQSATGKPNTVLQSSAVVTPAVATATQVEWTGFSTALTNNTQYYLTLKNLTGTAGNNITWGWSLNPDTNYQTSEFFGFTGVSSTDNEANWSTSRGNFAIRLEFSDGSFFGWPVQTYTVAESVPAGDRVYSTRENGMQFTTPANAKLITRCIIGMMNKIGTPTGSWRFRLYAAGTLIGTTGAVPVTGNVQGSNSRYYKSCFTTSLTLAPNTQHYATLAETAQADSSSNAFGLAKITTDTSVATLALRPFQGTMRRVYYDGSSWTATAADLPVIALLLDPTGEFASQGGATGNFGKTFNKAFQ